MDEESEFWRGDVWKDGGVDEDEGDEDEGDVEYASESEDRDEDDENFDVRWYVSDMVAASGRFVELEDTGDSYTGVDGGYWGEFSVFNSGIWRFNLYVFPHFFKSNMYLQWLQFKQQKYFNNTMICFEWIVWIFQKSIFFSEQLFTNGIFTPFKMMLVPINIFRCWQFLTTGPFSLGILLCR